MIEFDDYKVKVLNLKPDLENLGGALKLDAAKAELQELEEESGKDGFWSDLDNSQKVLQKITTFVAPGEAAIRQDAERRTKRALTIRDAASYRNISAAENGSFAGWMLPGATIEFKELCRGKKIYVEVKGDANMVVRVLFNNSTVAQKKLEKSGRQTVEMQVYGNAEALGSYLLHFPQGGTEFYSFRVEK